MNVSTKLVNSPASMLTEEQFREFKRNVAIENCPGMTFASEWASSEDGDDFVKRLAEESDDLGYVTSLDIAGIIENGSGNLLFSKYLDQAGNVCQVYGTKESIAEFAEGRPHDECKEFRRKNLDTSWNPSRFFELCEDVHSVPRAPGRAHSYRVHQGYGSRWHCEVLRDKSKSLAYGVPCDCESGFRGPARFLELKSKEYYFRRNQP